MLKSVLAISVLLVCLVVTNIVGAQAPQVELSIRMYRISAEVAATRDSRARGLMGRESMPQNVGMVFVYSQNATHCMWMRNTLIPISVAFLDDNGIIINIEQMAPQTENSHCAKGPARFALEMNAGWFREKRIMAGQRVNGVAQLPVPRVNAD